MQIGQEREEKVGVLVDRQLNGPNGPCVEKTSRQRYECSVEKALQEVLRAEPRHLGLQRMGVDEGRHQ